MPSAQRHLGEEAVIKIYNIFLPSDKKIGKVRGQPPPDLNNLNPPIQMMDIIALLKIATLAFPGSKVRIEELFDMATEDCSQDSERFTISMNLAVLICKLFTDNNITSTEVNGVTEEQRRPLLGKKVIDDPRDFKGGMVFPINPGHTEEEQHLEGEKINLAERYFNQI